MAGSPLSGVIGVDVKTAATTDHVEAEPMIDRPPKHSQNAKCVTQPKRLSPFLSDPRDERKGEGPHLIQTQCVETAAAVNPYKTVGKDAKPYHLIQGGGSLLFYVFITYRTQLLPGGNRGLPTSQTLHVRVQACFPIKGIDIR